MFYIQNVCVPSCLSRIRLCDPMDHSLPGSSVRGILRARILEWIAMPSSRVSSWPRDPTCISYISGTGRWALYRQCHHSVMSDSLLTPGLQLARLLYPWNSPGKNTGVGSHSLVQGIFPSQGSNLGLLQSRQILYHLSHQGSPVINEQIL